MTKDYIYFIQQDCPNQYIKIGKSWNPLRRLQSMQTSNPYKLTLLFYLEALDLNCDEKFIHEGLNTKRVKNEWFNKSVLDNVEIKDNRYLGNCRINFGVQYANYEMYKL